MELRLLGVYAAFYVGAYLMEILVWHFQRLSTAGRYSR